MNIRTNSSDYITFTATYATVIYYHANLKLMQIDDELHLPIRHFNMDDYSFKDESEITPEWFIHTLTTIHDINNSSFIDESHKTDYINILTTIGNHIITGYTPLYQLLVKHVGDIIKQCTKMLDSWYESCYNCVQHWADMINYSGDCDINTINHKTSLCRRINDISTSILPQYEVFNTYMNILDCIRDRLCDTDVIDESRTLSQIIISLQSCYNYIDAFIRNRDTWIPDKISNQIYIHKDFGDEYTRPFDLIDAMTDYHQIMLKRMDNCPDDEIIIPMSETETEKHMFEIMTRTIINNQNQKESIDDTRDDMFDCPEWLSDWDWR